MSLKLKKKHRMHRKRGRKKEMVKGGTKKEIRKGWNKKHMVAAWNKFDSTFSPPYHFIMFL
jgi:hypothetical protein